MAYQNPSSLAFSSQVEAHEERLQRIEVSYAGLATSSNEALLKFDFLNKQIIDTTKQLSDQIKSSFDGIDEKLEKTASQLNLVCNRVVTLEDSEKHRKSIIKSFKKYFIPLLIAAASVIATQTGQEVWNWMTR
jgi:myo-inositol-1-phosphate synthase